ncbi:MAG TPA: hypothetical protein VFQ39_14780 [Longimicrobium sp.]|nr:hypothetical protein [Longimicrobium sp.]
MGDAYRWPSDWVYGDGHRVEDDPEFHEDVSIVLLAMLELITGEVPERYGSLVHDEGTPGVGSMMLPWWAVRHRYGPPPEAGPDEEDVITSGGPVRAGDDEAGAVRRRSHGFLRWLRMILGGGSDVEGGRR